MAKCCFTLKSGLKKTRPIKKRSIVNVTESCCCISFQASSISLLQWISSKIKIDCGTAFFKKISKYCNVAFLRWLPSTNRKSIFWLLSITEGSVFSKLPSINSILVKPDLLKIIQRDAGNIVCDLPMWLIEKMDWLRQDSRSLFQTTFQAPPCFQADNI